MTVYVYQSSDASAPTLNGTAGSLISVLDACLVNGYGAKTAAGWGKAYSGTNLAAYRAPSGNRLYLRVDDTGTTDARLVCYATMSDVNTGTGQFPTSTQVSGGLYCKKSSTADATGRGWVLVATQRCFYFFPEITATTTTWATTTSTTSGNGQMFFGEFTSYKPNDAYNTAIIATASASSSTGQLASKLAQVASTITGTTGHYLARGFSQFSASTVWSPLVPGDYSTSTVFGSATTLPAFPDPVTGGVLLAPIDIVEPYHPSLSNMVVRGRLPGLYCPVHNVPASNGDTFDGAGDLTGKTFMFVVAYSSSAGGRVAVEISDTW